MQLRVDLDTSGKLPKILDAVMNNTHPASGIDQAKVAEDLETLFKATEGKLGTNEHDLFCSFLFYSPELIAPRLGATQRLEAYAELQESGSPSWGVALLIFVLFGLPRCSPSL